MLRVALSLSKDDSSVPGRLLPSDCFANHTVVAQEEGVSPSQANNCQSPFRGRVLISVWRRTTVPLVAPASPRGKTNPPALDPRCGVGWGEPISGEPTGQHRGLPLR